jgi:hypothetical protein
VLEGEVTTMTTNGTQGWQYGAMYRVRAVKDQVQVKRTPNKGTMLVEVMCEVTQGPAMGRRAPYTRFLNNPENVQDAIRELRALGWRGTRFGDWTGLFSRECQAKLMGDEKTVGNETRTYPRFAFLSPLRVVSTEHAATEEDLSVLNDQFGGLVEAIAHDEIPF